MAPQKTSSDVETKTGTDQEKPRQARTIDRVFAWGEDLIYAGVALLLFVAAVAVLIGAASELLDIGEQTTKDAALEMLDSLLLVFIVVELLFAVRTTVAERELLAEPFLLIGIIASIKEIVVLSVRAADEIGKGQVFTDHVIEIGILGLLVFLLAAAAWLLRLKEREPEEAD